jgi:hypothetical protein
MQLDAILWLLLPIFIAAGSSLLSFYIMQARLDVAVAKERTALAEARGVINSHRVVLEERVKATEEQARRKAFDEFMREFRVEERNYIRDHKTPSSQKKYMIVQERLFFRNIPLSDWVEHELTIEENGADVPHLAKGRSVFSAKSAPEEGTAVVARLFNQTGALVTPQFAGGD